MGPQNASAALQAAALAAGQRAVAAAGTGAFRQSLEAGGLRGELTLVLQTRSAGVQIFGFGCAYKITHSDPTHIPPQIYRIVAPT